MSGAGPVRRQGLHLLASAGTRAGAADGHGVAPRTVRLHLEAARSRLGVETTTQAVYVLVTAGELEVPELT